MSNNIQAIHDDVASILLEPAGFTLGLLTETTFLQYYREVMDDFLGRTGLIKAIAVIPQEFGIPQYTLPDWLEGADNAFSDGAALRRDFEGNIASTVRNWQTKVGQPRSWRQDKQTPQQVSIFPAPNTENPLFPDGPPPGQYGAVIAWAPGQNYAAPQAFIGTIIQTSGVAAFTSPGVFFGATPLNQFSRGNFCVVGAVGLLTEDVSLGLPVESLTDDWDHFIKYGILEKVWMADSELKDIQRARYAHARYEEGCMLAAAVMGEVIDAQ